MPLNETGKVDMSKISNQHDEQLCRQTNETGNVSTLISPSVSCWEAGRWELTKASVRKSLMTSMPQPELAPPIEAVSKVAIETPNS
jgi:hypothetical protein